jgi:hypothetical protein
MVFCRVQDPAIQLTCQHREQHISKQDYEISAVQEIHIYILEPQRWTLEFVISFSKVFIWDLALRLANCFKSHVNQISIFSIYFSQLWKVKIFSGNCYVCPIWIFLFDTCRAQINSALCVSGSGPDLVETSWKKWINYILAYRSLILTRELNKNGKSFVIFFSSKLGFRMQPSQRWYFAAYIYQKACILSLL